MPLIVKRLEGVGNVAYEDSVGAVTVDPVWAEIDATNEKVAFRFTDIEIPLGAKIHQAFVRLYGRGDGNVDVYGLVRVGHGDIPSFTAAPNDISNRPYFISGATLEGSTGGAASPFGIEFENGLTRLVSNSTEWKNTVMVRIDYNTNPYGTFSTDMQFFCFTAFAFHRPELHILWEPGSQHDDNAEVFIFNRDGALIEQVTPELMPVSWKLNQYGKATFRLGKEDQKLIGSTFEFGNRVFIRFGNGLPLWGGVLEPPRRWTRHHVEFTAYSAEYLLSQRVTPKTLSYRDASGGEIFEALIRGADLTADLDIVIGDVWGGGDKHSPTYHYLNVYNTITESIIGRLEPSSDWDITPEIVNNRLIFVANYYEFKGERKDAVLFQEGWNISSSPEPRLIEQGPIVNSWALAGADISGETLNSWGESRITAEDSDQDSINQYGLRSSAEVNPGITIQSTLDTGVASRLSTSKRPYNIYEFSVINKDPALYQDTRIGDIVRLTMPGYGFSGTNTYIRIQGMEYNPRTKAVSIIARDLEDIP